MRLLQKPRAPLRYPLQNLHIETQKHQSWTHFIDFNKWKVEIGDNEMQNTAESAAMSKGNTIPAN
jgi:hypothetical protein